MTDPRHTGEPDIGPPARTGTQAAAGRATAGPGISSARDPWSDSRFWVLQLAVLALALIRLAVTVAFGLDPDDAVLEISTIVIFAVPVVVAALDFGVTGGLVTMAWVCVLDVPRLFEISDHGRMSSFWSEAFQLAALLVLALLVGSRVTAETRFRTQADTARTARLRAELLYQDMFESNRSPILIVDGDGTVVGSNAAADGAFGVRGGASPAHDASQPQRRLVDVVGPDAAARLLTRLLDNEEAERTGHRADGASGVVGPSRSMDISDDDRERPLTFTVDGRTVLYRPTSTRVGASGPDRRMQVIFEDVTTETRRHDLIEAFAGQVVLGQEEERRHIAQELHDGPLQTLIHLCRQIDALDGTRAIASDPDFQKVAMLASMRSSVEDTVAELRSIARGLRPSVLDDLGLVASINQVISDATDRQGFESSFTVDGPVARLSPAMELAVFRIAQEAITNAERHAEAERIDVTLQFGDGWLGLTVADDGRGFDPSTRLGGDSQSLGLPGMNERARLIGGRLRLNSGPDGGTTVEARVPVDDSNSR